MKILARALTAMLQLTVSFWVMLDVPIPTLSPLSYMTESASVSLSLNFGMMLGVPEPPIAPHANEVGSKQFAQFSSQY